MTRVTNRPIAYINNNIRKLQSFKLRSDNCEISILTLYIPIIHYRASVTQTLMQYSALKLIQSIYGVLVF